MDSSLSRTSELYTPADITAGSWMSGGAGRRDSRATVGCCLLLATHSPHSVRALTDGLHA